MDIHSQGHEAAKKDWDFESQRMWEIFRGAYITICASSSMTCQDSFLEDRNIPPGLDVTILTEAFRPQLSAAGPGSTRQTQTSPNYKIIPSLSKSLHKTRREPYADPMSQNVYNSIWHSRGWVHQEISFSQRLVIFGTDFTFFSCSVFQACENGWRRRVDNHFPPDGPRGLSESELHNQPFFSFTKEVSRFCHKDLTFETDCLPAMAGLASQVAKVAKVPSRNYLAGLWRDNLAQGLLFAILHPNNKPLFSFKERICILASSAVAARPSWSWIGHRKSFQAGAVYDTNHLRPLSVALDCKVVNAVAIPIGQNPFGQIKEAYLTISCRMITLKEFLGRRQPWDHQILRNFQDLPGLSSWWDVDLRDVHEKHVSFEESVALVCISKFEESWENWASGLYIYPTGHHEGEYYRVGKWDEKLTYVDIGNRGHRLHRSWPTKTITLL